MPATRSRPGRCAGGPAGWLGALLTIAALWLTEPLPEAEPLPDAETLAEFSAPLAVPLALPAVLARDNWRPGPRVFA